MAEAEGARTVKVQNSSTSSKAILRIKRKRSADPADILLVSQAFKKVFTDKDHQLSHDSSDQGSPAQRIFRLAGTVSKKNDESLPPEILTKLSSNDAHKSKVKVNPKNELTVDAINAKLRGAKQLARQTSRYKVVSKHRDIEDDMTFGDVEGIDEVDAAGQEMLKLYQLYDVVLDEAEARNVAEEKESEKEGIDPNAILCNSVKMIREKLRIDEVPKTNLEILEKDYVYDVYCAEDDYGALSDILDIVHLNESQLVTDASDEELNYYDDDDDSNDENNWRNDYPDEDQWNSSSDEEPRYWNGDFDYGFDGRRMLKEVSSDEERDYAYYGNDEDEYNYEILDEEYIDLTS